MGISKEKHIERHKKLHMYLDELVADYIACQPLDGKSLTDTTLMEFLQWSANQLSSPEEPRR